MKVKELIAKLQEFDGELEVMFKEEADKDYYYLAGAKEDKLSFDKNRKVIVLTNLTKCY